MLDDIALGPVLEQPAGKDAAPVLRSVIEHDQLDERPGFLRTFPLGGALAGAQPDDRTADTNAFAWLQRDIANEAVALVEEAEHRHALFHWRDAGIGIVASSRLGLGQGPGFGGRRGRCRALAFTTAKQHRRGERRTGQKGFRPHHGASGVHA